MSNYICKIRYVNYSNIKLLQTQNMTTIAEFLKQATTSVNPSSEPVPTATNTRPKIQNKNNNSLKQILPTLLPKPFQYGLNAIDYGTKVHNMTMENAGGDPSRIPNEVTYASIYNAVPTNYQKPLKRIIKTPEQRDAFVKKFRENPTDIPAIAGHLLDTSMRSRDYIEQVPKDFKGEEPEYLDYLALGNNPAYRGLTRKYYDPNDYTKTNTALAGLAHTFFTNKTLAIPMIEHYLSLPKDQREGSAMNLIMRLGIDTGNDFGFDTSSAADTQKQMLDFGWDNGTAPISAEGIYDTMIKTFGPLYNKIFDEENRPLLNKSEVVKNILDTDPYANMDNDTRKAIYQNTQNITDNPFNTGYFGLLKDPQIRRMVQYAAPWLMYGVPIGSIMSMFGNNSLWPLVLFGGLGSGVFGLGGEKLFGKDVMSKADQVFGTINSPLNYVAQKILPEWLSKDISRLTNPQPKQEIDPNTTFISPAEYNQNPSMYEDENGNLQPQYRLLSQNAPYTATGNARITDPNYNSDSTYYVNRNNNPMAVGSLQLA